MSADNLYTVKIGGQAGQGIKSAGLMLAKAAVRSGYNTYDYTEYPSVIRGGHNVMQITFSVDMVTAPRLKTDLLVALGQDTIDKHFTELPAGSGLLFDSEDNLNLSNVGPEVNLFAVPYSKLAAQSGGKDLLSNTVALGAVIALLDGSIKTLKELISEEFSDKGADLIQQNHQAAEAGYDYIKQNYSNKTRSVMKPIDTAISMVPKLIINGNEAVALGAIAAGLQFASIYPMSPISNILHVLAANQEEYSYVYKQPEDEISAITMAIGASYAGCRSMTATSGGGFCLMTEGYGLAGITETPVVIINGMRGGPATGLPTWSEQGDLRMVLHAHQGDFLRIVLAAGDSQEAFDLTMQAFNLAEKYQTPVVLLIDKNICENDQSFEYFDLTGYKINRGKFTKEEQKDYKRYALEKDGISLRSIPGTGNYFIANSDEHDEYGYSSEEIEMRNAQMKKRMQKLETCENEDMQEPLLFGPKEADLTLVSWGSNKGSILQVLNNYTNVNYLHIQWLNPFPTNAVTEILKNAKHIINIESNYTGQLAGLIREKTGILIKDNILKYDGRPIFPEEINEKIKDVLKGAK